MASNFLTMYKLSQIFAILRQYGWTWVIYRIMIAAKHKLGIEQRRMPIRNWSSDQLLLDHDLTTPLLPPPTNENLSKFSSSHPEQVQCLQTEADEIVQGWFRKFEGKGQNLGFPPVWNEELPGQCHPSHGVHWSQIQPLEDIKLVWELSRMGWAQILARAYAFTGNEAYPEAFWGLLENWRNANPPNQGPQWMCGQEIAIRSFALTIADSLFSPSPSSTPLRRARLQEIVRAGAERIEPHFHYARSQRNNHALNEALGLITAATLSPDATALERRWLGRGSTCFSHDLFDQLDDEGSYIQHSVVYHRVMLHACTWRLLLARRSGDLLDQELLKRIEIGLRWMVAMVDPSTGEAPNLGSNDGANILRLSSCAFQDHRPSIQGLAALLDLPLPYPPGPWDESVLWLTGLDPKTLAREPRARVGLSAPKRGHFLRIFPEGSLYFRCAINKERPSQSDPLHVDLTWRGINLLCDAGTYRYNAPPPWANSLAFTGVHNTVTVEGRSSMERLGPFLWLDWDRAEHQEVAPEGWLVGERPASRVSPMKHRRSISLIGPNHWIILDDVVSPREEVFRLHWLMPLLPRSAIDRGVAVKTPQGTFQLIALGPGKVECFAGSPEAIKPGKSCNPVGWRSSCYCYIEPALAFTCSSSPSTRVRWVSVAGEGPFSASLENDIITLKSHSGQFECSLPPAFCKENGNAS